MDSDMNAIELLEIDPLELKFPFELKKQVSCSFQLSNKTDDHVAFKVKTTNPKKYCVRPNNGIVLPHSTCDVVVTMQAQSEASVDIHCKDKFLVQSTVIDPSTLTKDLTAEMFSKESGNKVDEVKLMVLYVFPPQPPLPVHERSDEGSLLRASVSESSNADTSEPVVVTNLIKLTKENTTVTQQRLLEEKNTAIQLSNKLREEIELLKRELTKRKSRSFSFKFVVIIAVLGLILGCLLKNFIK